MCVGKERLSSRLQPQAARCLLVLTALVQCCVAQARSPAASATPAQYVGSTACRTCHPQIFERWKKTRMANVVRDPREHPDAIIPDLTKPDPLVNFKKEDVALVYGSHWKQRYFTKLADDYFVFPAQWDIVHKQWRQYFVKDGTDWWAELYPPDNMKRPTGPLCDGCHSVNYDIYKKTVTEWNVGCEKCHGPGSAHVGKPSAANIINPARLNFVEANDTCIQCHSQGKPVQNPINGRYYDWPVGFHMGNKLQEHWNLDRPELGKQTFTHFPDGTAHKNRMQGNDFVQSVMYERGVKCFSCHDVHGTENEDLLIKPTKVMCLECHGTGSPNGPHTTNIEQHTHHKSGTAGDECIACHMPKIEQTIADVNVRSHTFRFISPGMTKEYNIPNPCTACHKDKNVDWAERQLASWTNVSPWRVAAAPQSQKPQ